MKETEEEGRDQPNDKLTAKGDIPRFLTQVKSVTRRKAKERRRERSGEGQGNKKKGRRIKASLLALGRIQIISYQILC